MQNIVNSKNGIEWSGSAAVLRWTAVLFNIIVFTAPQTVMSYLDEAMTKIDQLTTIFPNKTLQMTATASDNVQAHIKAFGWPGAIVALSPNPYAASPILSYNMPIG